MKIKLALKVLFNFLKYIVIRTYESSQRKKRNNFILYISLPSWLKNEKNFINPKRNNENLSSTILASLHHNEININPERINN